MNILLVEDNEHDVFFVQETLKRFEKPIELHVVKDGTQARDFQCQRAPYAQAAQPTLIL